MFRLDNRGLEVLNDREPLFLFPELAARGFAWKTQRQADDSVQITIRRTA